MIVDIQQATMENKTATITVTRKDNGVVTVYTVKFIADSSQNPTFETGPPRSVYLSDLPAPEHRCDSNLFGWYSITPEAHKRRSIRQRRQGPGDVPEGLHR